MFLRGYLETYTYSLVGCSVNSVWASNTLVVGSTREGSESDSSDSKFEYHVVKKVKTGGDQAGEGTRRRRKRKLDK